MIEIIEGDCTVTVTATTAAVFITVTITASNLHLKFICNFANLNIENHKKLKLDLNQRYTEKYIHRNNRKSLNSFLLIHRA